MPNAVVKIREVFLTKKNPLTLSEISDYLVDLKRSEVSMALRYFYKNGFVTREKVPNKKQVARKTIYEYTYQHERESRKGRGIQAQMRSQAVDRLAN